MASPNASSDPVPDALTGVDDQLIVTCAAFDVLESCINALNDPADPAYIEDDQERDDATAPIEIEQSPLLERMCFQRAATPMGARARARSFLLRHQEIDPPALAAAIDRSWDDRMLAAILRDLVQEGT